jgi:DNA-binding SARP family transcriptional activator
MTLLIHLLGPVRITRDGNPVEIPGHRPLALLAYLLVTGKAHSRQHLVDLLFESPDDPRAALRWTLSKLRKAIGKEYLVADRQQIGFAFQSDYWLDVAAFEAGELDLYRGDFLEGLHVRDAHGFEDWVFFERERLRGRYQGALTEQLAEYESQGDDAAAIETAQRLLRSDNLREDGYRALMRAYARAGRREAALTQYAQCRQVLEEELGVPPSPETSALYERIRAQRAAPAEVPTPTLLRKPLPAFLAEEEAPAAVERPVFVARERELARLDTYLEAALAGQGQVVFVTGGPGRGKTALMGEFSRRAMDKHPGLLVASGVCNAYSGVGDPYLPFREVLDMLTGDVEARWAAGTITPEQALRLCVGGVRARSDRYFLARCRAG